MNQELQSGPGPASDSDSGLKASYLDTTDPLSSSDQTVLNSQTGRWQRWGSSEWRSLSSRSEPGAGNATPLLLAAEKTPAEEEDPPT